MSRCVCDSSGIMCNRGRNSHIIGVSHLVFIALSPSQWGKTKPHITSTNKVSLFIVKAKLIYFLPNLGFYFLSHSSHCQIMTSYSYCSGQRDSILGESYFERFSLCHIAITSNSQKSEAEIFAQLGGQYVLHSKCKVNQSYIEN